MTEALLTVLALHANHRGIVLAREEPLLRELKIERTEADVALAKLEQAGLIEILEPLPFLVLRLRTWPGEGRKGRESRAPAYSRLLHTERLNSSYRPGGAPAIVDPALLKEILEVLGESDARAFEKAVELYSPHVIRLALERVRRAKGIRKSRTALFRHLLPRLAHAEHHID